jgi:predicted Holliday junction resolvase-like endonuclease
MHLLLASVETWIAWAIVTLIILTGMVWIRKDQKRQIRRALHSTESSLKEHSRKEAEVLTRSARMLTREETKRLRDDLENTIGAESEEFVSAKNDLKRENHYLIDSFKQFLKMNQDLNKNEVVLTYLRTTLKKENQKLKN